ncbi:hypothetical protein [Streptomyces sp. NPDC046805]|uniref:hypothetical protein n=1 Tax=Streptomyces sp. NPDC046805 TaxID=3155134 RepID=UPI0033C73EB0
MGWTHDYSDAPRNRRSATGLSSHQRGAPQMPGSNLRVGISLILRRRARWVTVRIRHPRG